MRLLLRIARTLADELCVVRLLTGRRPSVIDSRQREAARHRRNILADRLVRIRLWYRVGAAVTAEPDFAHREYGTALRVLLSSARRHETGRPEGRCNRQWCAPLCPCPQHHPAPGSEPEQPGGATLSHLPRRTRLPVGIPHGQQLSPPAGSRRFSGGVQGGLGVAVLSGRQSEVGEGRRSLAAMFYYRGVRQCRLNCASQGSHRTSRAQSRCHRLPASESGTRRWMK